MGKKPAEQTSNQPNGSGDEVDLENGLNDESGAGDGDQDDDQDDDEQDGAELTIAQQIERGIAAALPTIQKGFQSEMDRRINSALAGGRKKGEQQQRQDQQEQQEEQQQGAPRADVRGARLAFRDALPDQINLFSAEERKLATDYGQNLIRARALQGFDDEDQVGHEVAVATAQFLQAARSLYSSRTKRVLDSQGLLVKQDGSGQAPGGKTPPNSVASAYELAEKKDRELYPERYIGK